MRSLWWNFCIVLYHDTLWVTRSSLSTFILSFALSVINTFQPGIEALHTWLCLWNCPHLSRKHRHRWCKYCLLPPKMPEAPSIQNGCKAIVEAQHSVRAELHTVCKGCCSRLGCITTSRLVTSPLCWEKHSYHLSHNWRIATYCFSRTALR